MVEILGVWQEDGEMIVETYNRKFVLAGNTGVDELKRPNAG